MLETSRAGRRGLALALLTTFVPMLLTLTPGAASAATTCTDGDRDAAAAVDRGDDTREIASIGSTDRISPASRCATPRATTAPGD